MDNVKTAEQTLIYQILQVSAKGPNSTLSRLSTDFT